MGQLGNACHTTGLCDTSPLTISGTIEDEGYSGSSDEVLTLTPSGDYPSWIHNGLMDSLSAAINAAQNCSSYTHQDNCGYSAYYCPCKSIESF